MKHSPFWVTALVSLALTGQASASVLLFTDQQAFLDAAGALSFEGFENTSPGLTGSSRGLDGFILGPLVGNEEDPNDTFENLEIIDNPAFAFEGNQSVGGEVRNIGFFAFTETPTAFGFTIFDFGNAVPPGPSASWPLRAPPAIASCSCSGSDNRAVC